MKAGNQVRIKIPFLLTEIRRVLVIKLTVIVVSSTYIGHKSGEADYLNLRGLLFTISFSTPLQFYDAHVYYHYYPYNYRDKREGE